MELSHLRIESFRNLAAVELEAGTRFNIFFGANGQGKTNLLESIYMLGAVKSFRPQRNSELIRWGDKIAIIEGRIDRAGVDRVARITVSPQGKQVHLNGSVLKKLSSFFGSLNVTVFAPDDLAIVKAGPDLRRRFLDRAIFNLSASYLSEVMAYQGVVKRRNALLRTEKRDLDLLEIYDQQLASHGATVVCRRLSYLNGFRPIFEETFRAIFEGEAPSQSLLKTSVTYKAAWAAAHTLAEDPDPAEIQGQLTAALEAARSHDFARRYTTAGPHRDDLIFKLGGHPAKAFASQGQQRAIILAMKIAEVRLFEETRGFRPILLLDDVSSELDRTRNSHLFDFLKENPGQVFITTTHRDHILLEEQVRTFSIEAGAISEVQ